MKPFDNPHMQVNCQYCGRSFMSPEFVQYNPRRSNTDEAKYCSSLCARRAKE